MEHRSEKDAAARAAARSNWPIVRVALTDPPADDLSDCTTANERLAMMERLALDAWHSAGLPIPRYTRAEMPGRVVRKSDGGAERQ